MTTQIAHFPALRLTAVRIGYASVNSSLEKPRVVNSANEPPLVYRQSLQTIWLALARYLRMAGAATYGQDASMAVPQAS